MPSPLKLRPISILSAVYKVYMGVHLGDLGPWLEDTFPKEICSYLKNRDARDNMMEVMADVESAQATETGPDVYVVSLDASKAFPSISRTQMEAILRRMGMDDGILRVVLSSYDQGTTRLRVAGKAVHTSAHRLKRGIHQGCPMSVILFLAIQLPVIWLLREEAKHTKAVIFADDVTLVGTCREEMQHLIEKLEQYYASVHIVLNGQKTQILSARGLPCSMTIGGKEVWSVKEIKVLGITIRSSSGKSGLEDIGATLDLFVKDGNKLKSMLVNVKTKENIYRAFTMNKAWYCPWVCAFRGPALTRARTLTLRAVRPTLERGPRLANAITTTLTKGVNHDPLLCPMVRVLNWMQKGQVDVGAMLDIVRPMEHFPRGPYTLFRFLCNQLGLTIVGDQVALDDYDMLPIRMWQGDRKQWCHRWRDLLRQASTKAWWYRRGIRMFAVAVFRLGSLANAASSAG